MHRPQEQKRPMIPFVASQIHALVENIRLLEAFVTAPLGLYSDLKMMRESLPFLEAADLTQTETQERRIGLKVLAGESAPIVLETIAQLRSLLAVLERVKAGPSPLLDASWLARSRRVLARAEQKVAGEVRAATAARVKGLYVIVDPETTSGRPVAEVAKAALEGGTAVIQLRDKHGDKGQVLPLAIAIKAMCEEHGALFVVNDDADVAVAAGAHGLHVGQTDLPVGAARRILSPVQLVGRSNNSAAEAMDSRVQGADYFAVGAVFPTSSLGKAGRNVVGPAVVQKVKSMVDGPVVAIGGINADNIAEVVKAGADCICVVSAVTLADDPAEAARRLVDAIQRAAA